MAGRFRTLLQRVPALQELEMAHEITTKIEIGAPAARVWAVLSDFAHYPDWNPFILEVLGSVVQDAKVKYRFEFPPGIRIRATAKILKFEQEKELRWAAHFLTPKLFNGEHYFAIEAINTTSIMFHHGEIFTGLLLPLARPMLEKYGLQTYQALNNKLKQRAVSGANFQSFTSTPSPEGLSAHRGD